MSHFIRNNKSESLSAIINNLLPSKTKAIDFLVGYFYFSGMKEIYQNIEDKPMRLLVGLDMDRNLLNNTAEFDFFAKAITIASYPKNVWKKGDIKKQTEEVAQRLADFILNK